MNSTTLTILIAVAFLILAVVTSFISARIGSPKRFTPEWWSNWIQGLSSTLVVAVVAVSLIGVIGTAQKDETYEMLRQQRLQIDERLKRQLILQMGSPDNAFALEAVRQLNAWGWLFDGSLQSENLANANLQGVQLEFANLQEAHLGNVNLQKSSLYKTNLQLAYLGGANLQDAYMYDANLEGAFMRGVNLQDANLGNVNLQNAVLLDANLQGASLKDANLLSADFTLSRFNEDTILTDGTYWTPETDMSPFTDRNHPQFWRSNNPESPAYGGDTADG